MDPFAEGGSYPDACVPGYAPASLTVSRADIEPLFAAMWSPERKGYVGDQVMRGGGFFGPEYAYVHNQKGTYESGETQYPYTEWIELAIDEPVYIFRIVIGMPRGPGAIVAIRALDPASGGWVALYEAKPLLDVFRDKKSAKEYWRWAPQVCRTDFKADTLRIEMDTSSETGISDWNYVDYVEIFGSREIQPHVLGVNGHIGESSVDRSFRVIYVANENANGEDSFEYAGNDCLGDLFRTSEPGVVKISITSRNDAPVQLIESADVVLGAILTLNLTTLVGDVETPVSSLHVTITALPDGASVTDGDVLIQGGASLPHTVTSEYLTLHFSDDAWSQLGAAPDEIRDGVVQQLKVGTLQFEAVDEHSATLNGSLQLRVLDPQLTCLDPRAVVEYRGVGVPTCEVCAVGTFAIESRYCSTCGDHATTLRTGGASAFDCVCQEGYYRAGALTPTTFCEPCPDLALCPLDTTVATLQLRPGVWRHSNRTRELLKCAGRPSECSCLGQNYGTAAFLNIAEPLGYNTYGSSCTTAWDAPTQMCAGKDLSDPSNAWCLERWCYVTDKDCPGALPTVFFDETVYDDRLYYSYEQCGSPDYFFNNETSTFDSPCMGGIDPGNDSGIGDGYCKPGHFGPRCEACATGSHFDVRDHSCKACPTRRRVIGFTIAGLVGFASMLALFEGLLTRPPKRLTMLSQALKRIELAVGGAMSSLGGVAKLKIFVGFVQVWTSIPSLYDVEMPSELYNWFDVLSKVSFELDDVYPSVCMGSKQTSLFVSAFLPLIAAVVIILASVIWSALQRVPTKLRGRCNGLVGLLVPRNMRPSQGLLQYATSLALPPVLLLIFTVAPSVSRSLFEVWACERIRFEDGASLAANTYSSSTMTTDIDYFYLKSDVAMRCYAPEHDSLEITAVGLLMLWPCSALALFWGVLFSSRHAIMHGPQGKPSQLVHQLAENIGVLHREYRPNVYWWEVLELARRLLLTGGLILFVPERHSALRLVLGTSISLAYLALQLIVQPYRRDADNSLGAFAALALCAAFFFSFVVRISNAIGPQESLRVLGLRSSYSFSLLMVIVMVVLLVVTVCALAWRAYSVARAAARAQAELDALAHARGRMANPPTCKWQSTKGFCAFLSHYKEEAGSDARYLSDLMRAMTHCPAFLDSANLCDLRLLYSDGVHKSDTIVVLATAKCATPTPTPHMHMHMYMYMCRRAMNTLCSSTRSARVSTRFACLAGT